MSVDYERQERRGTVRIDHDTEEYHRENAQLPWCRRLFARSALPIVFAPFKAVSSVLLFLGTRSLVGAVLEATSGDHALEMGMWFLAAIIAMEITISILRTAVEPTYLRNKPLHYLMLAFVWSVSLIISEGKLGMWSFFVCFFATWLATVFNNVVQRSVSVVDATAKAALYAIVCTVVAFTISGYIYLLSTVTNQFLLAVLTGGVHPAISHLMREIVYDVISKQLDKQAGLSDNDDVERGTFITIVMFLDTNLEIANKISIARIASPSVFAGTMAVSLAVEVISKAVAMVWHRNKEKIAQDVKDLASEGKAAVQEPEVRTASSSFKKASHRHDNANDKKRYEFRIYYEELGENVATLAAFGVLIATRELEVAGGLARLAFALLCEYIADLGVWSILELDGYYLTNVEYRFSLSRIATVAFALLVALSAVQVGEVMVKMAIVNGTAAVNATPGH